MRNVQRTTGFLENAIAAQKLGQHRDYSKLHASASRPQHHSLPFVMKGSWRLITKLNRSLARAVPP